MAYSKNQGRPSPHKQTAPDRQAAPDKKLSIVFKDGTYVDEAEKVIQAMKRENFRVGGNNLTMSQLRNLAALTSSLYDEVQNSGAAQVSDKLAYLRVQFVYQSGRNAAVKKLVETGDILGILKKVQEKNDRADIIRFCRYMEALVAYFKYYGGQD